MRELLVGNENKTRKQMLLLEWNVTVNRKWVSGLVLTCEYGYSKHRNLSSLKKKKIS